MCQYRNQLDFHARIAPASRPRVSWPRLVLVILAAIYAEWWLR